ncbi:MAG: MFS transporter [Dehalococcoidia bacterium]
MDSPTEQHLDASRSRMGQMLAALRYSDFRVLWISTVSNQLGQGMQQVLLGWLVFELTGSGGMVGAVFAARSAPNLIVGFLAGSVTDRVDRRTLMRVSIMGMILVSGLMGVLGITDNLPVWGLLLATLALGGFQAFYMTARQTFVLDIVGSGGALNGIALISMAQRVGGIFGALVAGGVIQRWGPGPAFMVMGVGYVAGLMVLCWLRREGASVPQQREPLWQNLVSYFNAIRSNRALAVLMVTTAAAEIFGFSHQVVLPILAKEVLAVGPAGLGLLTAFRFFGGALGVFAGAAMGQVKRQGVMLLTFMALFGAGEILLSQSPNYWSALVFVTLINIMATGTDILHHTLLQLSVPNDQRGRAMGAWIVGIGMAPIGQLEIGYLSGLANSRIALLTNGLVLAAGAVGLGIVMPRIRRLGVGLDNGVGR